MGDGYRRYLWIYGDDGESGGKEMEYLKWKPGAYRALGFSV